MRRALTLSIALLTLGCAQNAILELQIELPASPPTAPEDPPWFAQIQVRDAAGHPFDIPWMGGDESAIQLTTASQWDCISVVSNDETLDVHVRVRFCRSLDCLDLMDGTPPERLYSLEHPFYVGRRTYYQISVPGVPDCVNSMDCSDAVGICIEERCGCRTTADCGPGYECEPSSGCVEMIDRCEIEGCIDGVSATFCSMDTGLHFCERNADIPRDDAYMCSLPE